MTCSNATLSSRSKTKARGDLLGLLGAAPVADNAHTLHCDRYSNSMDLFNKMAHLETQHNIPRGTLRFKEGEECQGVGCG